MTNTSKQLINISRQLSEDVMSLDFPAPVANTYNPLYYAWAPHQHYLERYGNTTKEVLFVGMNPGPFGMAQTGIPFGDVVMVRDWLKIEGQVSAPERVHEKRPIMGFACKRREVSGTRLWGWARERFKTPECFFAKYFVWNYCPLCFMESSGKNLTPDKLPATARAELFAVCDRALREIVKILEVKTVLGVGNFALLSAERACADLNVRCASILHPSPANPAANRAWAKEAETSMRQLGIFLSLDLP